MVRTLLALLATVALACGQAFTARDTAFLGNVTTPVSGAVWAPTNAYAWYNADSISGNNGDAVTVWNDSSGNGKTMSVFSNATAYAPYLTNSVYNGHKAVVFTKGQSMTNAFGETKAQPLTIFCVMYHTGGNYSLYLFDGISSTPRIISSFSWLTNSLYAGTAFSGSLSQFPGALTVWTWLYSGASSYARTNGVDFYNPVSTSVGTGGSKGITLGGKYDFAAANRFGPGHVCELIIYAGAMADGDRNWVENNLKTKYGL